jgi:hypothetical protein
VRGGRTRPRPLVIALAAAFALALPLPAMAQEALESPAPAASASAEADASGIAFPVMLGGQVLTAETYTGPEWLELFDGEDGDFASGTEALVAEAGKTIDDLTVKTAMYEPVPGEAAVVAALRLEGTDAREWIGTAIDVMVGDVVEPGLVLRPLTTKWALRVTDQSMPGVYPRTVYLKDDTAWIIQGDEEYVWEALEQLPEADPVAEGTADSLYTDMPMSLAGERRLGLYESTEPLFMPTLSERLGGNVEDWLLDLYLEGRISPAEMIGVLAWWGLGGSEDGIQIEGYRLPDGGEAFTQRLLDEVFLVRPPEVDPDDPDALAELDPTASLLQGVEFTEEEIAGQAVTTLDFGGIRQHIFSSADTIWVISDPLGEPEKVAEAI